MPRCLKRTIAVSFTLAIFNLTGIVLGQTTERKAGVEAAKKTPLDRASVQGDPWWKRWRRTVAGMGE